MKKGSARALFEGLYRRGAEPWTVSEIAKENYEFIFSKCNKYLQSDGLSLDAGCGEGLCTEWLAKASSKIVAFDISKTALIRARARVPEAHFIICDLENLPFREGIFSSIVSLETLYYLKHPEKAVRELYRVSKAGSYTVISVYNSSALVFKIASYLFRKKPYDKYGFYLMSYFELLNSLKRAGYLLVESKGVICGAPPITKSETLRKHLLRPLAGIITPYANQLYVVALK